MFNIKGIRMNASEFQRLSFVIINEEQQGWKPTKADVKELVRSDRKPSITIKQTVNRATKQLAKDA